MTNIDSCCLKDPKSEASNADVEYVLIEEVKLDRGISRDNRFAAGPLAVLALSGICGSAARMRLKGTEVLTQV